MTCHHGCSYFRQQEHGHCHQAFALTGVTVQNTSRVSWVGQIAREGGSSTLPVLKTGERLRQEHLARTPATAAALATPHGLTRGHSGAGLWVCPCVGGSAYGQSSTGKMGKELKSGTH